jgi:hypothetical protein
MVTSPLTCNVVPSGGSIMVCFQSPLTDAWGKSNVQVSLSIVNGKAQLLDAFSLLGKEV